MAEAARGQGRKGEETQRAGRKFSIHSARQARVDVRLLKTAAERRCRWPAAERRQRDGLQRWTGEEKKTTP